MWSFSNMIEALSHLLSMAESTLTTHFNSKLTIAIFGASSFATLVVLSFTLCGVLDEIMTPTADSILARALGRNVSKLTEGLNVKNKELQIKTNDLKTAQKALKNAKAELAWYDAAYASQMQTLDNRAVELRNRERIIRSQDTDLARADHRAEAVERSLKINNDYVNGLIAHGKDRHEKVLQQENIIELQAQQIKDSSYDLKAMSKRIVDVNLRLWECAGNNTVADQKIAELKLKLSLSLDTLAEREWHCQKSVETIYEQRETIEILEGKVRKQNPTGEHLDVLMEAHAAFRRNHHLEVELANTKDEVEKLQRNPSEYEAQITALRAKLANTQKQLGDAKTELLVDANKWELALRKANLATAAAQRESPSTQVKERVDRLELAAEKSQKEIAALTATNTAQTTSIADKIAQIASLTSQLTHQTECSNRARECTDRAVTMILQLRSDAANQQRTIEDLTSRLEANEGARQVECVNVQHLTGLLETRENEVIRFREANEHLEKELVLGDDFVEVDGRDVEDAVVQEEEGEDDDVEDVSSDDDFDVVEVDEEDDMDDGLGNGVPDVEVQ